jgi:hypothetical protein
MKTLGLLLLLLAALRCQAATEFVHLTDPHVFDKKRPLEAVQSKAAFKACIERINELHTNSAPANRFSFVALTGDIGLDSLTDAANTRQGLDEFRTLIAGSAVKTWLFVPGNNDLDGEFPTSIGKYHRFISTLSNDLSASMRIIDLCPSGGSPTNSRSRTFSVTDNGVTYDFLGFDNASFKNENTGEQAKRFAGQQVQNVVNLVTELASTTGDFAYVLYHIPEIDDPYYARTAPESVMEKRRVEKRIAGDPWLYSAWTVSPVVRQAWEKVTNEPRVMALIAGHFHSSDRRVYENLDWLKTTNYSLQSTAKLMIAPPISCKLQTGPGHTARGFRTYVAERSGKLIPTTHWLQGIQFEPESPTRRVP